MDEINALRIQLTEQVNELPTALQSSFPDLGVDFLHHVFSDVMEMDDIPAFGRLKRRRVVSTGTGVAPTKREARSTNTAKETKATNAEPSCSSLSNQALPRMTRSNSKRLRSLSNTTVGDDKDQDNSESEDDATTATLLSKDSIELKQVFERALEHIDRVKIQSKRLEEAALSIGARQLASPDPMQLVRCLACGKTINSNAISAHKVYCREAEAQTATMSSMAYTNDTASEMNAVHAVEPVSNGIKSNIAPIKTVSSGKCQGLGTLPLSPVAISLAGQRAGRSRSFQRVPNTKIEAPLISPLARNSHGQHPFGMQYAMVNMVPGPQDEPDE